MQQGMQLMGGYSIKNELAMSESRLMITLKDGTPLWVTGEQYQKILSGELDPEAPLSPEREAELEEAEQIRMEQLRQLLAQRTEKTDAL